MTLLKFLTKHRITTKMFARRVRMSESAITKYRIGQRLPRPDVVEKIRRATGNSVKPSDWYGRS